MTLCIGFSFTFVAGAWGLKALAGSQRWPPYFVGFATLAHGLVVLTYFIGAIIGFANTGHMHKDLQKHAGFGAYCTGMTVAWGLHTWYFRKLLRQAGEVGFGHGHKVDA